MRIALSLALLLSLSACASGAPRLYEAATASAPAGPGALDCALREATARGYVPADGAEGVFVRAERGYFQPYENRFDVVTASVAGADLRVQGTTERATEDGRVRTTTAEALAAHVAEIAAACGG